MFDYINVNQKVGWRWIESEIVVFNCSNQKIAILNNSASLLWEKLWSGANYNELIDYLISEFHIDTKTAQNDISSFLYESSTLDLISININNSVDFHEEIHTDPSENILLLLEMDAIKKKIPFSVTIETTYSCNEHCIHCSMDRNLPSLSTAEIKLILNDLKKENCLFISLTGGEFFKRKDALEIIEYASHLNFVIDVLSNGTLISNEKAQFLANHKVRRVQISLYGACPKTHDFITKLTGSFNKTLKAINYLLNAGIKVEIAFPLMKNNFDERMAVKQLSESLGCLLSPTHIITARNNGSTDTFDLRLSDIQLSTYFKEPDFSNLYAGRKPFKDHQLYLGFDDLLDAAPCYAGFNSCAISPSGDVFPCNQLFFYLGNIRKTNFSEIWHNSGQLNYFRSLTIRDHPTCSKCNLLKKCTRCPGLALLENNDLLGPSPENCRITNYYQS